MHVQPAHAGYNSMPSIVILLPMYKSSHDDESLLLHFLGPHFSRSSANAGSRGNGLIFTFALFCKKAMVAKL